MNVYITQIYCEKHGIIKSNDSNPQFKLGNTRLHVVEPLGDNTNSFSISRFFCESNHDPITNVAVFNLQELLKIYFARSLTLLLERNLSTWKFVDSTTNIEEHQPVASNKPMYPFHLVHSFPKKYKTSCVRSKNIIKGEELDQNKQYLSKKLTINSNSRSLGEILSNQSSNFPFVLSIQILRCSSSLKKIASP